MHGRSPRSGASGMVRFDYSAQAFGLSFQGNRPLPEMNPFYGETLPGSIIDIEWCDAEPGPSPVASEPFRATDKTFDLQVPGVADYSVAADRIAIKPKPDADDRSIRTFLFGSAIGALLHLRGMTVLHGSAVALPDGSAAVFCGHSTAGKSTLAAALGARKHPALADDITAVRFDAAGQAWCLPGLARTKLWRDALDTLGLAQHASAATRVMPDLDKHSLSLVTGTQPLPLRRFYELQARDEGGPLTCSAVTGIDKVTLLLAHVYRPAYVHAMGLQPALLRNAAALARQLGIHRIVRPRHEPTLPAIVAWLEAQWAA